LFRSSNSLFKSSIIYTLSNVINASINFLLIPILTKNISTEEYGMLGMFTLLITFFSPFIGMSIHGAITRRYFEKHNTNFAEYIGSCFGILGVSVVIVFLISFIFRSQLSLISGLEFKYILCVTAICFFQFITLVQLSLFQVQKKPIQYAIIQLVFALMNIALTIYFVAGLKFGWEGRILGYLLATIFVAIWALIMLVKHKEVVFCVRRIHLKHAIAFSLPLIPHSIGAVLISISDRFILKNTLGLEEAGLYMLAYQLASVLSILCSAFNSAYIPWLFEKLSLSDSNVNVKIVRLTYFLMIGLLIIYFVILFLGRWLIPLLVDTDYVLSLKYFPWILLSFVFNGMYLLVTNYLFYAERTSILGYMTAFIALANIPITIFFIELLPFNGAAISLACISCLMFLSTWFFSAKYYPMPWSLKV